MLPQRVLVVEDDPDVRLTVEAILRTGGLQVDIAERASAASRLLNTRLYHLVIADVRLGEDNGIEIADSAVARGIPALVITGYSRQCRDDLTRHAILDKPFQPSELLGAVHRQLSG